MNLAEQIYELNLGTGNILRSIASELNLTLPQVQCFLTIPFDSINMTNLSRQLGIDNSTLTRNLAKLDRQGFIHRTQDEFDKRVIYVSLTKNGKETLSEIESKLEDISHKILTDMNYEDRQDIFEALEKLSWSLEKINYK
tara:strand:+ start:157 stop:576 length:420 start_codon:yes stop_codon:yes gene_type:complete